MVPWETSSSWCQSRPGSHKQGVPACCLQADMSQYAIRGSLGERETLAWQKHGWFDARLGRVGDAADASLVGPDMKIWGDMLSTGSSQATFSWPLHLLCTERPASEHCVHPFCTFLAKKEKPLPTGYSLLLLPVARASSDSSERLRKQCRIRIRIRMNSEWRRLWIRVDGETPRDLKFKLPLRLSWWSSWRRSLPLLVSEFIQALATTCVSWLTVHVLRSYCSLPLGHELKSPKSLRYLRPYKKDRFPGWNLELFFHKRRDESWIFCDMLDQIVI